MKIFLFTLLCIVNISAQVTNDTLKLSLNDAINKALEKNWDIQIAQKDIQRSQEQINEAYANAFPRLEFSGRYVRNIKLPVLFLPPNSPINPSDQTATFELGSRNAIDAGFSISQVIYNQKVNTAIQIAGEYSQYSIEGDKAAKSNVILEVKRAFYNVLLMKKLITVTRQNNESASANYENVGKLFEKGVASEYDYLRSEVQLANVQPLLIQTENNLTLALNYLKSLLAIDMNQPIDVQGDLQFEEVPTEQITERKETAITNNPSFRQLSIQESLLDRNVTIQRSDYYPTLAAFGSYNFQTQDNTFKWKDYQWARSFNIGLQFTYTLFDGFSRSARIEQAIIDREKVTLTKRKVEEGLKMQLTQTELKMIESKKRIAAQEKNLQQAEKTKTIAETRYRSGIGTQLEIIDTQTALTFAQTNYAQAIYDYLIAKAEWEKAVSY